MLKDIVEVRPLDGYRLFLRFEDGAEGGVDLAQMIRFEGFLPRCGSREVFGSPRQRRNRHHLLAEWR